MAVKLSALRAGRPLPSERFLVLISVRGWFDSKAIVLLKELRELKTPITSSGTERATFRLVAKQGEFRIRLLRNTTRATLLGEILRAFANLWVVYYGWKNKQCICMLVGKLSRKAAISRCGQQFKDCFCRISCEVVNQIQVDQDRDQQRVL
jgi:hypothetical protein